MVSTAYLEEEGSQRNSYIIFQWKEQLFESRKLLSTCRTPKIDYVSFDSTAMNSIRLHTWNGERRKQEVKSYPKLFILMLNFFTNISIYRKNKWECYCMEIGRHLHFFPVYANDSFHANKLNLVEVEDI